MGLLQPHVRYGDRRRKAGLSGARKAITVHSLRQARAAAAAAVETGVPVLLLSAPSAAASTGPAWFDALVVEALSGLPDAPVAAMLDCGAMPGHALAALRYGWKAIRYDGPSLDAISDIASQSDATVTRERPVSLDPDAIDVDAFADACRQWLRATEER
jgi:fructose/tagatose bisphosphate aldolase